jgi:predicted kinase
MPNPPSSARSVKIGQDERTGWSSDRPRPGGVQRPPDFSVRCRVLRPTDRMRYSPGSLVTIVSASGAERDRFAQRTIEERGAVLSLDKVRGLLAGRVAEEEMEAKAAELLTAAVVKRLEANESVVVTVEGLDAEARAPFVQAAARVGRPRHLILIETGKDQVQEDDRAALNELRRTLDAGELGTEGFQTAMRLGGGSVGELKRIVFRSLQRDDE